MSTGLLPKSLTVALALAVVHCGPPTPEPVPPTPAQAPSPAAASPSAAPTSSPQAPSPTTPAVTPPATPSPFSLAALGYNGTLNVYRLENGTFVGNTSFLAEITDKGLEERPKMLAELGAGESEYLQGMVGRWPDNAWAMLMVSDGCDPWTKLGRWERTRWRTLEKKPGGRAPLAAGWGTDQVVLLTTSMSSQPELRVMPPRGPKPKLTIPLTEDGYNDFMDSVGLVSLGDGQLMLAQSEGKVARWAAGQPTPSIDQLEGVSLQGLVAEGPGVAYAVGERRTGGAKGFVARFDGQGWQEVAVPATAGLSDFRVGADGTQWLAGADEAGAGVWHRPRDGQWARVALPAPPAGPTGQPEQRLAIEQLVIQGPDDVWLFGTTQPSFLLAAYRTRPTATPFKIPEEDEARRKRAAYQPPKIATRRCTTLFALLFTPSKVAAADYSYPLTREALKGHTEFASARFLEAEHEGVRYFGAIVQDFDLGERLVKLIREKIQTKTPVLLCREPYHVLRDIRFDLRTGELSP